MAYWENTGGIGAGLGKQGPGMQEEKGRAYIIHY
jgi:hypothetical protein